MKRIALVTPLPIEHGGGTEAIARDIIDVSKGGEKIKFSNISRYGGMDKISLINQFSTLVGVAKRLEKENFDLIHGFGNSLFLYSNKKKIPVVQSIYGNWHVYYSMLPKTIRNQIYGYLSPFMEKECAKKADIVITNCTFNKQMAIKYYDIDPSKIRVIITGIDTRKFRPLKKKRKDNFTAIWVGTNPELKKLDFAIELVAKIKKLKLLVVGIEGENRSNVTFLGKVKPADMPFVYNKADFLILPSKFDSMPMVVLEAMASGLPAIISETSHVEIIENYRDGIVCKTFNRVEYEKAIGYLMDDANLEKLGMNAREKAEEFDVTKQINKYYGVYEELLNEF